MTTTEATTRAIAQVQMLNVHTRAIDVAQLTVDRVRITRRSTSEVFSMSVGGRVGRAFALEDLDTLCEKDSGEHCLAVVATDNEVYLFPPGTWPAMKVASRQANSRDLTIIEGTD